MVSLCISCCDRQWQIEKTLAENLSVLGPEDEIVLVNYGSRDGLTDWIWSNFQDAIQENALRYFDVKSRCSWSSPKAKNLSHRLAQTSYVFNLDADNFVTVNDMNHIRKSAQQEACIQQWTANLDDGSFGRIGLPKNLFFEIGGYDESFLPMSFQDTDLIIRLEKAGYHIDRSHRAEKLAIQNSVEDKLALVSVKSHKASDQYSYFQNINKEICKYKLATMGPKRTESFASYEGLLNGELIRIDGFNNITRI